MLFKVIKKLVREPVIIEADSSDEAENFAEEHPELFLVKQNIEWEIELHDD